MNNIHWSSEYLNEYDAPQYVENNGIESKQSSMVYTVPSYYASMIAASPSESPLSPSSGVAFGGESFITSPYSLQSQNLGSPDSLMSGSPLTPLYQVLPPLVQSSSSTTINSTSSSSSVYISEAIAKASALPESFYPEFLQYSKESFEQTSSKNNVNTKRRRQPQDADENEKSQSSSSSSDEEDISDERRACKQAKIDNEGDNTSMTELRRQIHIQSEQKRRAQIKDGFEDLRNELPACLNKKMSKVTLLHRTVQHIQHLKSTQISILAELERLIQENEQLRKFQQGVLQKQALENMYPIGNI
ncbi:HLH-domain-containing protein [Backusella circina FSU 941]|nr:HLH-domain-containing protein [Backusella circina FSU 941]